MPTEVLKADAKLNCARCGHSERQHDIALCNALIYGHVPNPLICGHVLCPCAGFVPPSHTSVLPSESRHVSGQYRSFFVDVHFDEAGAFVGLLVQEHGERKNATDERGLAQAIRNYFEGNRRTGG